MSARITKLRAAAFVVAAVAVLLSDARVSAQTSPRTETISIGGRGGNRNYIRCDAGQVVVGLTGAAGDVIHRLGPICTAFGSGFSEKWVGPITAGDTVGGSGGDEFNVMCPPDTLVTGFSGAFSESLINVRLQCQFPYKRDVAVPAPPVAGAHPELGSTASAACSESHKVNLGILVFADQFVNRLALACDASFLEAPPKRPPVADQSPRKVPYREVPPPGKPPGEKAFTTIFSVDQNHDLFFSKFMGMKTGAGVWAKPPIKFGNGWNFRHLFSAGDGVLIAITATGDVLYYKCNCLNTGTLSWVTGEPLKIAEGWPEYKQVFYGGDGVIFAIEWGGDMYYYKYFGLADGAASWGTTRAKIGNGWNFGRVFSTGNGAIFTVSNSLEEFLYYKFEGMQTGDPDWSMSARPLKVDWALKGGFRHQFSAGDGVILGVTPSGDMFYYRYRPELRGTPEFQDNGVGKQVGSGWGQLDRVFAY